MVQDAEVVKLIAEVLREMVHGEVIQAKAKPQELLSFDHYLHKTYCKTAALIALSCEAVAVLGQQPHVVRVALKSYGRHLGIAYQLIDDLLDFTASTNDLGKPALADMAQGLATAPTLFALEEFPELDRLILRGFSEHGDAAIACDYISRSRGVSRTQELAASHTQQAANAIGVLRPSEARDGLLRLCSDVLNRRA
uniref:Uncharacterized protein n=1 Tax=Haptolina ericina TaxID=156174 RepID=A0A7S3ATS5_9EUKA|mmetsp:Transcript_31615/g.71421  ORF Transcript_31615/g.71421 Transcript_31615/m.71421 type:complete len:196 (+) Transcript_31615:704-1291(+)